MFLTPSSGPDSWRALLADPEQHWRTGYSAKALAYCWEEAKGFPISVRSVFDNSPYGCFHNLGCLIGAPEYKVPLPPSGGRPSQNDLFVLGKANDGLVSIMVEGKVSESFDKLVSEWKLDEMSPGKKERLQFLIGLLEFPEDKVDHLCYQLLHRTASALIEARRFCAKHALMLVHSFSQTYEHFEDYAAFVKMFGDQAERDRIVHVGERDGIALYLGWVWGEEEYLRR